MNEESVKQSTAKYNALCTRLHRLESNEEAMKKLLREIKRDWPVPEEKQKSFEKTFNLILPCT
tara:strand:+ start:856 stop:1044 length:189 start_codon:yes stop_codon:yes gene_type:complete